MTIHTTPTQRKEMAHAISELLGEPAVYMRTPTYAFQIGNVTVNRDGSTSCDNIATLERLKPMLIEKGYLTTDTAEEETIATDTEYADAEPVQEPTDEPAADLEPSEEPVQEPTDEPAADLELSEEPVQEPTDEPAADLELSEEPVQEPTDEPVADSETSEEPVQEPTDEPATDLEAAAEKPAPKPGFRLRYIDITTPMEGITVQQLKNLVFMLYSKQNLLNKVMRAEFLHIDESVVSRLQEYTPETVEEFESLLEDFKALGDLDGMTIKDAQLTLHFPYDLQEPVLCLQFDVLQRKLIEAAMKATRTNPRLLPLGDNEKYLMHSWLIRIGCSGPDFKMLRKVMTYNLTGYCAFPDQSRADKHKAKYAEIRRARREIHEEADA